MNALGTTQCACDRQILRRERGKRSLLHSLLEEWMNSMNEIDQIEQDAISYEVSDEAMEVAGTRTESAGAWTFVCTGIGCKW
jgi:hypothetical protein